MARVIGRGVYKTVAVLAVLVAIFWVFAMLATGFKAEAVIGGIGNVTMSSNPHNFSASSSGIHATAETQVCIFCHTPHHALQDSSLLNGPLWNHQLSSALYNVPSNTIAGWGNMLTTALNPPDGSSKMCLSCHDGTIGIGNLLTGQVTMASDLCLDPDGSLRYDPVNCRANLTNDISSKHPVSIPFNAGLITAKLGQCSTGEIGLWYPWQSGGSNDVTVLLRPTSQTLGTSPGIAGDDSAIPASIRSGGSNEKYKAGYRYGVQCSTCHDPHLWTTDADGDRQADRTGELFVVTDTNSLCRACHCICDGTGGCN